MSRRPVNDSAQPVVDIMNISHAIPSGYDDMPPTKSLSQTTPSLTGVLAWDVFKLGAPQSTL